MLILELLLGRGLAGQRYVVQLELHAEGASSITLQENVEIELEEDAGLTNPVPPNIVSALGKLAIFKMQEKTMEDLDRGEIEHASQRLETMATRLLNIGENELAKAALLEAGRLTRTGHLSPEGRKKIRYGTRGLSMLPKEISHG